MISGKMKVIYIAGAYRSGSESSVFDNIMKARAVAQELWHKGWIVICPHTNTMFMGNGKDDTIFLEGDLELLRRCDAIYMLKGWQESEGATAELRLARELDLDVYGFGSPM